MTDLARPVAPPGRGAGGCPPGKTQQHPPDAEGGAAMTDLARPVAPPGRGAGGCPPGRHSNIRRMRKEAQR